MTISVSFYRNDFTSSLKKIIYIGLYIKANRNKIINNFSIFSRRPPLLVILLINTYLVYPFTKY